MNFWNIDPRICSESEFELLSEELESCSAPMILIWAYKWFGESLVATSSFQTQSIPLLHLISRVTPQLSILFLDTGYHFPETLAFQQEVTDRMLLNVKIIRSLTEKQEPNLYEKNPTNCCYLNKVEPLDRALSNCEAWITGVRRDQTAHRQNLKILSRDRLGKIKICPLLKWDDGCVESYAKKYKLPSHPLKDSGYLSVGCYPCTKPSEGLENARDGRWTGMEKTECGLHL